MDLPPRKNSRRNSIPPGVTNEPEPGPAAEPPHGAPAQEQDPKRRLGQYGTAGEHPITQNQGMESD